MTGPINWNPEPEPMTPAQWDELMDWADEGAFEANADWDAPDLGGLDPD